MSRGHAHEALSWCGRAAYLSGGRLYGGGLSEGGLRAGGGLQVKARSAEASLSCSQGKAMHMRLSTGLAREIPLRWGAIWRWVERRWRAAARND